MRVTRRQFLECAAAVSLAPGWNGILPRDRTTSGISILDLGSACTLPESVAGYRSALGARVRELELVPATPPAVLIVPAAAQLRPAAVRAIVDCLDSSGCVILETGLAFAPAGCCASHRTGLCDVLGIQAGAPVSLWSGPGATRVPYVDFTWPHAAKLRDHSRVVPLEARRDRIIASVDGHAVGLKGTRRRGTLIVLGSPIGPALWAGDTEAHGWLDAVLSAKLVGPSVRPRN